MQIQIRSLLHPGACCFLGITLILAPHAPGAPVGTAWLQRYNAADARAEDWANKVVADAAGNVITVGTSSDGFQDAMLVLKYSSAGVPLWTNRFSKPGAIKHEATGLAVDQQGTVFITGSLVPGPAGRDYATLAYSSAGAPLWTNFYNGPGNEDDHAAALALDTAGNVYVTGYSAGNAGNGGSVYDAFDYATIAYTGAGVPRWTNRYDGPLQGEDSAAAVAVDGSGNVFVTGWSTGTDGFLEMATVAYSAEGGPLWTQRFRGTGQYAVPYALAVDASGNVFVTGSSGRVGGNATADYVTVAYSNLGAPLWSRSYNGPQNDLDYAYALAVSDEGDVIVTGRSVGLGFEFDYATIAYSAAGTPRWTNRYDGAAHDRDSAFAVAVDGGGSVFVTGFSRDSEGDSDLTTVAYSDAGAPLWTNRFSGPVRGANQGWTIVSSQGHVVVGGFSMHSLGDLDLATIVYSSAGLALWTNLYNSLGNTYDEAIAVDVDAFGRVFVTGTSGLVGDLDYATIAYTDQGLPLWTNIYNGLGKSLDSAKALAVDRHGRVIVTGSSGANDGTSLPDYATVSYSGSGVPLWTNRYNGFNNSYDEATAVAADADGNVFVTGESAGDYATVAYSVAGVPLWTNRYAGPVNGTDRPTALAVDNDGNVVIAGWSTGTLGNQEFATIAYSGAGLPLWTNRYCGLTSSAFANALAVDEAGRVFVTGWAEGAPGGPNYATLAYSGAGVPLWTNLYDGPGQGVDSAEAVGVDANSNVFVTGRSYGNGSELDFATIAYSGTGVPLWTNRYNGPDNAGEQAWAIGIHGNWVVVTGYSMDQAGHPDYATVAYTSAGVPLWTNRYNGPANGDDAPLTRSSLVVGPDGAVYVTGTSDGNLGDVNTGDYATLKYVTLASLAIQPRLPDSPNTQLTVSGAPDSNWTIERTQTLDGPWIPLGAVTIGNTGSASFLDFSPPEGSAFYRARQP